MANNNSVTVEALPATQAQTFKFCFHGFESLPSTRGEKILSPEFSFLGHQWRLELYPGGCETSTNGIAGLFLHHLSDASIVVNFRFIFGDRFQTEERKAVEFKKWGEFFAKHGWSNCASRAGLLSKLQNGTLILSVSMSSEDPVLNSNKFLPPNPFASAMQKTFNDEKSADISFAVGACIVKKEGRKKAKASSVIFHAHRLVLKECAPILADICESFEDKKPVPISDMEASIFGFVLQYIYGHMIPEKDLKTHSKEIIEASDKYGVVGLKLRAEACYVESTTIDVENVIDNLLYADSKNCALLNEAVMDFIIEHGKDILDKVSFDNVPGGMLSDLLASVMRGKEKNQESANGSAVDFSTMRVSALRKMCHEKGLDFDGSRKTMVELLKNAEENGN